MAVDFGGTEVTDLAAASEPSDGTDNDSEFQCQKCGHSLTYAGKGRKPVNCTSKNCFDASCACKGSASSGASRIGTSRGSSGVLQAVSTLEMAYSGVAMILVLVGAVGAAGTLAASTEQLSAQNRAFLEKDPALVKAINKVGTSSGRAGFFLTNAMVLGPVAVLATAELKDRFGSNEDTNTDGSASGI